MEGFKIRALTAVCSFFLSSITFAAISSTGSERVPLLNSASGCMACHQSEMRQPAEVTKQNDGNRKTQAQAVSAPRPATKSVA